MKILKKFVKQSLSSFKPSHIVIYDFLYEKVKPQLSDYSVRHKIYDGIYTELSIGMQS